MITLARLLKRLTLSTPLGRLVLTPDGLTPILLELRLRWVSSKENPMVFSLKPSMMSKLIYQIPSMLESNGELNALLFGRWEINQTAVLAGLSVLLKLSLIDLALPSERTSDSPLRISFLAALLAEMVAMVVIPFLLCNTTLRLVSSLVIFTEQLAGAKLTLSLLALTTLTPPSTLLALVNSPPLLALSLAILTQLIPSLTTKISTRVLEPTRLELTKKQSRPKSWTTDLLKSL
jgi:hypothetical protein